MRQDAKREGRDLVPDGTVVDGVFRLSPDPQPGGRSEAAANRRRARRSWLIAASTALLALAAIPAAQAQSPGGGRTEATAQGQILVMLRLSPDHLRPNASYGGDYGDQTARLQRRRLAEGIARRHGLELVGEGWPMPLVGFDCYPMRIAAGRSVEAVIQEVSRERLVALVQPAQSFRAGDDETPAAVPR